MREASAAAGRSTAAAAPAWKFPCTLSGGHPLQDWFPRRAGCGCGRRREAAAGEAAARERKWEVGQGMGMEIRMGMRVKKQVQGPLPVASGRQQGSPV